MAWIGAISLVGLSLPLSLSGCATTEVEATKIEPTPGIWHRPEGDDWINVCSYMPGADINDYIACGIKTHHVRN